MPHAVLAAVALVEGGDPLEEIPRLAEALDVDPSQLVGILDTLEDRGLVDRQRDPDDRRRHVVRLTTKGRKQLVRLRGLIDAMEDELFTPLDAKTRKQFHETLLKLVAYHDPRGPEGPCRPAPG